MRRYFGVFIIYKLNEKDNFVLRKLMGGSLDTKQVSYGMVEIEASPDATVKQIADTHRKQLIESAKKSMEGECMDIDVKITEIF